MTWFVSPRSGMANLWWTPSKIWPFQYPFLLVFLLGLYPQTWMQKISPCSVGNKWIFETFKLSFCGSFLVSIRFKTCEEAENTSAASLSRRVHLCTSRFQSAHLLHPISRGSPQQSACAEESEGNSPTYRWDGGPPKARTCTVNSSWM